MIGHFYFDTPPFLYSSATPATGIYTSVFQRNRVADYLPHPPFLCNNISRLIFISVSSAISVADDLQQQNADQQRFISMLQRLQEFDSIT